MTCFAGSMPISFALLRNFPASNQFENMSLVVTPEVISAKVGTSRVSFESPVLMEQPVVMDFGFQTVETKSSHICVYWNFSQPLVNNISTDSLTLIGRGRIFPVKFIPAWESGNNVIHFDALQHRNIVSHAFSILSVCVW